MSAREDRYKEYLKEKRTEANRLKQRRLRERRAKHLEALEKTVLSLQEDLVRATAEIQHLKVNNARLGTENRRLAEQLLVRAGWDAGHARAEAVQHVDGRYTEQALCPRPIHPTGGASDMMTISAHNLVNMNVAVEANGAQGHRSEGRAPLSPPLSLYHPAEPLDRPRQAGSPSHSGTNAQPDFGHPGHSLQALVPPARDSHASLLSVQSGPTVPYGPVSTNALSPWGTGGAIGVCSGGTSVACSPTPFPPSLCSGSTATMISRPDTPASSIFGTHPYSSYPAYVNSGPLGSTAGTSFWPYTVDHAFVPRTVLDLPALDPPHTSCAPPFALGPCSAVASAPQIASWKPVKGATRAANAKPPLVPPGVAGVPLQWIKDTGGSSGTAGDQDTCSLLVRAPRHPVSESKLFWPV